jgi:hypothetical protein
MSVGGRFRHYTTCLSGGGSFWEPTSMPRTPLFQQVADGRLAHGTPPTS